MRTIVVYESMYGNTRAIAEAIAEGLGADKVLSVSEAEGIDEADLLVVGGPTHMHGLATSYTRKAALAAAEEDGNIVAETSAGDDLSLRRWLHGLPRHEGGIAATFDTRLDRSPTLTGTAARGIARRLRRHGYEIAGRESFLVEDSEGPLAEGELERARAWGVQLAQEAGTPLHT